jgi:hypothetical protein
MKNIISFIKKYQVIIFLSFLLGVLIIWKVLLIDKETKPAEAPFLTPTPTLTQKIVFTPAPPDNTQEIIGENENQKEFLGKYPLVLKLPYPDKNFYLRYDAPLSLEITSKNGWDEAKKQEILEWIERQGVDSSAHKIEWREKD